ncbi:FAS-associated death domain protein [Myripristis murdjan]|uniref:Fas (tnfrsf6)-associated via death domain n=1 Tax=Myripristis murdjan TaxID=586833 RepID=A0A667WXR0_9TELE|nr:FAS-associated death domain protein [Myripristis murdjan]
MTSSQFQAVLLQISIALTREQLEQMKFLCEKIGKNRKEKLDTGYKLFEALTERGELGEDNTTFLSGLLKQVHRQDLATKLDNYDTEHLAEPSDNQPSETERAKLDIATEVIVDNIGRAWRQLGRKLRLTEAKLESISEKHPRDLEETVRELLKQWRRSQAAQASAEELIKALRACQHNLTADKVEQKLKDSGY